jgi:hypothetical protein
MFDNKLLNISPFIAAKMPDAGSPLELVYLINPLV